MLFPFLFFLIYAYGTYIKELLFVKLIIGNCNFSSWSLRAWVAMKKAQFDFDLVTIDLYNDEHYKAKVLAYSPSGLVPALIDNELVISDSLAILEYLYEQEVTLWPLNRAERARARSLSAEMHSGFSAIRKEMPMNIALDSKEAAEHVANLSKQCLSEIERVQAIWQACRQGVLAKGPWLFGSFCIADAMYIPLALRFKTYQISNSGHCFDYIETVTNDVNVKEWLDLANKESL